MKVASALFQGEVNQELNSDRYKIPKDAKWTIILLCTDPKSYMQVINPYPDNCECIDITIDDDFTSNEGFLKVAKICRDRRGKVAIMAAFPCTGGCLFNMTINWEDPK